MPDHALWYIIERSKSDTKLRTFAKFWSWLLDCEKEDVVAFAANYLEKKLTLATPKSWAVASLLNGEMTEERFSIFLDWAISLGRESYEILLRDPDELAPFIPESLWGECTFDDYSKVPQGVWREKCGTEIAAEYELRFPNLRDSSAFLPRPFPNVVLNFPASTSLPMLFAKFSGLDLQGAAISDIGQGGRLKTMN